MRGVSPTYPAVVCSGVFADTISGVTRFEIFGGANAITYHGGGGGIIEAGLSTNTVGIDNVAAVPEPSTLGLLVAGCGAAAVMRRRRFSAATS
ncbi:MAG: PEP-CTERM sorting domain-containing protein [Verrucomicrobia bacterium]|nr:PEP-CTERM sorting domain-containing protein [Verrucomicrobiota bacterium]